MNPGGAALRAGWVALLALVLALACVFGSCLGFRFLAWDDVANLAANPLFDPPTLASLGRCWSGPWEHLYVPLSYSVWWGIARLSQALFGRLEPALFHGASLALHAGVVLLLFRWLAERLEDARAAFAGALLFALHPLQVESVAWASELRGLLAALFGFGALLAHGRGRRALALALFALALLSKPSAAAFALFVPLLELVWQRRSLRQAWAASWPWLALAAAAALVSRRAQSDEEMRWVTPLADRPLVALDALGFYLRKLAWPAGLCADYGRSPRVVLGSQALGPALLALGVALAAALAFPERRRALCTLALFAAALLPVLGFVPFGFQEKSTVADRYAYLALAGAALFAGLLVRRFGRPAFGAALGVALLSGALSFAQAAHWRDSRALFERVLEVNPRSTAAHDNLGFEALQQRDFEAARGHYLRALELSPGNALALSNLGACECELGRLDEGIEHLRQSIAASPRYVRARENLVAALGRKGLLEEAEAAARELAALDPQNVQAQLPLARVLRVRGKRVQAAQLLERILAQLPGWKPALVEQAALAGR